MERPNRDLMFTSCITDTVCYLLVYTTQVNSTFCACSLVSSEVISQVLITSKQLKKKRMAFFGILSRIKLLWFASYSAYMYVVGILKQ